MTANSVLIAHHHGGQSGPISELTLNRPERANSLSAPMVRQLMRHFTSEIERGAAAIVFAGSGKNFCGGFDFSDLEDETDETLRSRFLDIELLLQSIHRAPVPTVAMAGGAAIGAGADIFVACDIRLATPDTRFRFPGGRFGLVLGARRLAVRIGRDEAFSIIASSRTLDAEEALRLGLVTAILPDAKIQSAVHHVSLDTLPASFCQKLRSAIDGPGASKEDACDMASLLRSVGSDIKARLATYRKVAQVNKRGMPPI